MKILCAADLHLGRVPSRLPAGLPMAEEELGPAAAWRALVATCVEERPDALLLAGDLIDDERDLFGAYADLDAGLRELEAADVPVIAVAGNHDVRTLPRLAAALPHLTLLGAGGRWEELVLERGPERLRIVGWSFPDDVVPRSPLDAPGHELLAHEGLPTIGLLHADLDASRSRYAPVRSSRLEATAVGAWLLGHVHVPGRFDDGARIGYLGSLAAADPGEAGPRGAWAVELDGGELRFEHRPLAPLRYRSIELDVGGTTPDEAPARLLTDLRETVFDEAAATATAVRLRVVGRTGDPSAVQAALESAADETWLLEEGSRLAFVHDVRFALQGERDVRRLAELDDPVGVAARLLLTLRDPDAPEREALVADAREALAPVAQRPAFRPLHAEPLRQDSVLELLDRQVERVLDELLASRDRSEP